MAIIDSFKANTTSVEVSISSTMSRSQGFANCLLQFSWPADLSGLERIMLSAHGDLQRLLRLVFTSPRTRLEILKHLL